MTLGAIPYVLLVFANIAPSWGLFMPAFAAVGLGAALLWTGQGIYLSRSAIAESRATGESVELVTSKFNGYFWTAFQFNGAVGLIISSIIFQSVSNFSEAVKYMFIGFGIIGSLGVVILFFVPSTDGKSSLASQAAGATASLAENEHDPLASSLSGRKDAGATGEEKKDTVSLYETARLAATSRPMQLLIPIIFYNGASLGFNSASFPLIYQDTSSGDKLLPKSYVGYVAATFFLCNSLCSYLWGRLIPVVGRRPLFYITLITHTIFFALAITLTQTFAGLTHESPAAYVTVFAMAIIFAIGDSVLESQIPAIVQSPTFFPVERDRDAAISNLRTWQSLGFTVQFAVGIAAPGNNYLQALLLAPLMVLALISMYICDKWVQPIDTTGKKDYTPVSVRDGAYEEEAGASHLHA